MAKRLTVWTLRGLVAAAALALLAALSQRPTGQPPEQGMMRLAWRMVGQKVSLCRERSAEELEALPQHMRKPEECTRHVLPYRLRVMVDGEQRVETVITPGGAKGDRPAYVQEEVLLEPGRHRVEAAFFPVEYGHESLSVLGQLSEAERETLRQALLDAEPYRFRRTVEAEPGRIVLIELDEDEGHFRITRAG